MDAEEYEMDAFEDGTTVEEQAAIIVIHGHRAVQDLSAATKWLDALYPPEAYAFIKGTDS